MSLRRRISTGAFALGLTGATLTGGAVLAPEAHADAAVTWGYNCNAYLVGSPASWSRIIVTGTGCPVNGAWRAFVATGGPNWAFDSHWTSGNKSYGGGSGGIAICLATSLGTRCS